MRSSSGALACELTEAEFHEEPSRLVSFVFRARILVCSNQIVSMMAAARSPNQIMAFYARKKQKLSSPEPEPVAVQSIPPEAAPIRSYSTHPTYPFPIADLPVTSAVLRSGIVPASAGKVMKKGDLDLVYFQPFCESCHGEHAVQALAGRAAVVQGVSPLVWILKAGEVNCKNSEP